MFSREAAKDAKMNPFSSKNAENEEKGEKELPLGDLRVLARGDGRVGVRGAAAEVKLEIRNPKLETDSAEGKFEIRSTKSEAISNEGKSEIRNVRLEESLNVQARGRLETA